MRTLLITSLALCLNACQAPEAPSASGAAMPAPALQEQAPIAKAPVHAKDKQAGAVMTTRKPADPNRIPNDAIHAPYVKQAPGAANKLPSGHPPLKGGANAPFAPQTPKGEEGVALPLPLEGPGSVDELKRRLSKVGDAVKKSTIEEAFRLTFTLEREKRNPARAKTLLTPLVGDASCGATASRILGYVAVSQGFDFNGAMKHYGAAVEKDADYGEAHYALAFMHVRGDKKAGLVHFERAREPKVPDIRGIERFYPEASTPTEKQ